MGWIHASENYHVPGMAVDDSDNYTPMSDEEIALRKRAYEGMRMQVQLVSHNKYEDFNWYAVDAEYEYGINGYNALHRYRRPKNADNNTAWEEIEKDAYPKGMQWIEGLLHIRSREFYRTEKIRQAQVILHWLKSQDPNMLLTTSNHRSYRRKIVSNTLIWAIKDQLGFLPPDVLKDAMNDWEVSLPDKSKIQVKDVLSILGYQSK